MGFLLCVLAFTAALLLGRRSLAAGLAAVVTVGYAYGILRANYLDTFSHFHFDAAVLGLYASLIGRPPPTPTLPPPRGEGREGGAAELRRWVWLLLGWAGVMFLMPLQHPLIQLVGLRGNAFLLPCLLVGARLDRRDADRLALWMSALNVVAFGFALAEYRLGVPAFFPKNAVTEIIYKSKDVAGYTAYRIPACFSSAHSYGGAMVLSVPWLAGAWVQAGRRIGRHLLLGLGLAAAVMGTFMCAARMPLVVLFALLCLTLFTGKVRGFYWLGWLVILGGVGYVVSGEERLQRFMSLEDTTSMKERIEGSVNMSFGELLVKYPIGNGLGGGGTSIPFFLQYLLKNPIGLESEYSRILLELGIPGLCLWAGFIGWTVLKRPSDRGDPWLTGRRLMWYTALATFGSAFIGTGTLTSIPQSALLLISIGFLTTPQAEPAPAAPPEADAPAALPAGVNP